MTDDRITKSLRKQCRSAWIMVEDAIDKCEESEWRKPAAIPFFVPARIILHIIQTFDYYVDTTPKQFNWHRFGDWENASAEELPGKESLRSYLQKIRKKANSWLDAARGEGLDISDDVFRTDFEAPVERLIYAIRHLHHHLGQLSFDLQLRKGSEILWD